MDGGFFNISKKWDNWDKDNWDNKRFQHALAFTHIFFIIII